MVILYHHCKNRLKALFLRVKSEQMFCYWKYICSKHWENLARRFWECSLLAGKRFFRFKKIYLCKKMVLLRTVHWKRTKNAICHWHENPLLVPYSLVNDEHQPYSENLLHMSSCLFTMIIVVQMMCVYSLLRAKRATERWGSLKESQSLIKCRMKVWKRQEKTMHFISRGA